MSTRKRPGKNPESGAPKKGSRGPGKKKTEIFPLPTDVTELGSDLAKCDNRGLALDHFLPWWRLEDNELMRSQRADHREGIVGGFDREPIRSTISAYATRWEAALEEYRAKGYSVSKVRLAAASRVVVGLGSESVLETGIRLHHLYGFPIVPGSALKGLARSYALWQVAKALSIAAVPAGEASTRAKDHKKTPLQLLEDYIEATDEKQAQTALEKLKATALPHPVDLSGLDEKARCLRRIFGTTAMAGEVIFFDAVPADPSGLKLDLDIMNPHYGPYYQGKEPPADYHSPVPVFFLAIAPGSEFLFGVAGRSDDVAQEAMSWLQKALVEMGVGAKTSAGYGLWQEPSAAGSTVEPPAVSKVEPGKGGEIPSSSEGRIPPVVDRAPRIGDIVPAQVIDNSQKPIKVRLLVKGYEDAPVDCTGVDNLSSFPNSTYVEVAIANVDSGSGRVRQVRMLRIWRG